MKRKTEMEKISLIELNESYLPQMAELYREAFAGEPWNDDWSDTKQLSEYMKDISMAYNALNYGLLTDGKLVGMSVGKISHWWEGTNYNIEELCISPSYQGRGIGSEFMALIEQAIRDKGLAGIFLQTDSDKPSYRFYHHWCNDWGRFWYAQNRPQSSQTGEGYRDPVEGRLRGGEGCDGRYVPA